MKQTDPQFKLRLPAKLKDALDRARAENDRTLTAEIVARLEASFQRSGTEVDWAKRLELRSNELRLDTVRTHLFSAQQTADLLQAEADTLKAKNAAKEKLLQVRERAAVVAVEVERLKKLKAELLEENRQLVAQIDEASRPINDKLDSDADKLNQEHYRKMAASEQLLGVPLSRRTVVKR